MVAAPTRARPQYAPMELLQPLSPLWATRLHIALELAATLAFALSGVIEAARKRLDVVGVAVVAFAAAFGGVLRDVLVNEVPRALSDHRPYALWAFAGGWLYVVLLGAALPPWLALSITVVATAGLRVLSVYRDWQLPSWRD